LLKIDREFQLGCEIDKTDLSLQLPNGNTIYVSGAKDSEEIEKFRGVALRKIYIDECASFRAYIQEFVEDVLENCLTDYDGSLILIGTPGPVPAGYFYNSNHNPKWSHHKWTMHQNPWILKKSKKTADVIIAERAERRGIKITDPSIRREYFGEWIKDENSLVYKFNPTRNIVSTLPSFQSMDYVIGVDIGYKDADAIAVLGYSFEQNQVILVEEVVTRGNDITDLVQQLEPLITKYKPVKMVMDAGALGVKIQAEIQRRHSIPLETADKHQKFANIKLLNDDLMTGKFKAVANTKFEEDCQLVVWDYSNPAKPVISDRYHTDICDSVLYGFRACNHFFKTQKQIIPLPTDDQYAQYLENLEVAKYEQAVREAEGVHINSDDVAMLTQDDW